MTSVESETDGLKTSQNKVLLMRPSVQTADDSERQEVFHRANKCAAIT